MYNCSALSASPYGWEFSAMKHYTVR